MKELDFVKVIEESETWVKQQYLKTKQGFNSNLINIEKALYQSLEEIETIGENDVWEQSFINTATGQSLDKLGEEKGVFREGLSDEDFREKIITYLEILLQGATLKALKEYLENLGYTIERVFIVYRDGYDPDIGGNADGDIGDIIMTVAGSPFRNFLTFIELNETLTESDIIDLEKKIKPYHKVNNFVYIRNYNI